MFRISKFNHKSVTEIQLQFTENLDLNIGISNVKVTSNTSSTQDLSVKSVDVTGNVLTIETSPQAALSTYVVQLLSTSSQSFSSVSGSVLQSPTTFNFLGQERANDIRDLILNDMPSIYDVDNDTLIRKHVSNVSEQLLKCRTDIRGTGNSNYLSVTVNKDLLSSGDLPEEIVTRGYGPNDRLRNEGAYKILRVGKTPEGTTNLKIRNYNAARASALLGSNSVNVNQGITKFPSNPVSLRTIDVVNEVVSNSEQLINSFDETIITVSKKNVTRLNSVTLNGVEIYNIPVYGYSILENRYDTISGRKLLTLTSSQFKLSDAAILQGSFPLPVAGDELKVSYSYIDYGINAELETVLVSKLEQVTRAATPSLLTLFSLGSFPIVTALDVIPTLGGVSFLDPAPVSGAPFSVNHPAFSLELIFDTSRLPSNPGEYAVNYSTGQVVVYGATSANDGTGNIPPVASYLYRREFVKGVDYNQSPDDDEIVAVPGRDLINEEVKLTFNYERVFAVDVDFLNESHIEIHNEYVDNRIDLGNLSIIPIHTPVTNVFELFNETTGERYSISRFSDDKIHFSGRNLPRFESVVNERANMAISNNETLFVTEELFNDGTLKVLKIKLLEANILSYSGEMKGTNVNSSVDFTKNDIFTSEFFYDDVLQTVAQNVLKLTNSGDYLVDYGLGTIYLLTDADQSNSLGEVSYRYGNIVTRLSQISGINDLGYRTSVKGTRLSEVEHDSFSSTEVVSSSLPSSVERFYNDDTGKPILFGTKQSGSAGLTTLGSYEFAATDGLFETIFSDGYHVLRVEGEADRAITSISSSNTLLVDIPWDETERSLSWCIIDFNLTDGYEVVTTYEIDNIRGVYTVTDLQTNDIDSLTNLFDPSVDTIDGKKITFNGSGMNSIAAGTALAIDYSYGSLFLSYDYWKDVLRLSYEYGDNSINWAISDSLEAEEQYFVSYKYGALREKLLQNFGALTQIDELTSFPLDFDRELYRSFLIGTLQGFVKGPTVESIKTLVRSVTDIDPTITELTFNEWTVSRDNLHLQPGILTGAETYASGRFESGLVISDDVTLKFPGESYISFKEGSFESSLKPNWNGIDNDATLTFDINDSLNNIYIGASGFNPEEIPFSINRNDDTPYSPVGIPVNYPLNAGHYIWYDQTSNLWNFESTTDGYGEITSSGDMYSLSDGYNITSTESYISFDGYGDGLDGYYGYDGYDGYAVRNGFTFSSDDEHYIFDSGPADNHNRISLFKDGAGFLNLRVYDDTARTIPSKTRLYNLSTNIQNWVSGDEHFVCAGWRLNSAEGIDELHLFVDGQETSNLWKYGTSPAISSGDLYRGVADEFLTTSASKTIIGNSNGSSVSGSNTFTAVGNLFLSSGIVNGDTFTILDDTADGDAGPYIITGVSNDSLDIDSPLTLTLSLINFSVNRTTFLPDTNVDIEDFAIFVEDGYGERTELRGLNSTTPDYSITRTAGINSLFINNGVTSGEDIIINTLGLKSGRCRDIVYTYADGYSDGYGNNTIETRNIPPTSLGHTDVTKILMNKFDVDDGYSLDDGYTYDGYGIGGDGYLAAEGYITITGNTADGYFTNICQPSNTVTGKKLSCTLGGFSNIDFSGTNTVTITGTVFGGPAFETLTFTSYGTETTSQYFTIIDEVEFELTAIDPNVSFGSLQLSELVPITKQENGGEYAEILSYNNGVFTFIISGSEDTPFILGPCHYQFDYPDNLNIPMRRKGALFIGSDINGHSQFDGTVDQVVFLNEMLDDIRFGEEATSTRTFTEDYNSPVPLSQTPQTLMLLNLNDTISNDSLSYRNYEGNFITSGRSVNSDFGEAIVFLDDNAMKISNGAVVLKSDVGTIEFWISPVIDTKYDANYRFYVDATSAQVVQVISTTSSTLTLPRRAKNVKSIRLIGDDGTGINYFEGGSLFLDGKTVFLGTPLPGNITLVNISYTPISFNGDRLSIFKDDSDNLNFSIIASDYLFMISTPIDWTRNTWHKVKATWKTNSTNNTDDMRLFVDGFETGTITWGSSDVIDGGGTVYGSEVVGTNPGYALLANIDMEDTFSEISIGNSFDSNNKSMVKIDNLRFSDIQREPGYIGSVAVDLSYNSNLSSVLPVVSDNFTTSIYDFDTLVEETAFLSNLLDKTTSLFTFDVEVDDSFKRIDDDRSRTLLTNVIERMKPAHTNLFVDYISD